MAAGLELLGPAHASADVEREKGKDYLFDYLMRAKGGDFLKDCDAARLAGLLSLDRRKRGGGVRVITLEELRGDARPLQRPITRAFERKAGPLGRARAKGYVTMLAVDVERADARSLLADGWRAPGFVPEVDHLWPIVRNGSGGVALALHATRDDQACVVVETSELR